MRHWHVGGLADRKGSGLPGKVRGGTRTYKVPQVDWEGGRDGAGQ